MDDATKFDIRKCLPYLEHVENPNGEDMEAMKRYYAIFIKLYAEPGRITLDDYYAMWKDFGIRNELGMSVKLQAEAYSKDKAVMDELARIYPAMPAAFY